MVDIKKALEDIKRRTYEFALIATKARLARIIYRSLRYRDEWYLNKTTIRTITRLKNLIEEYLHYRDQLFRIMDRQLIFSLLTEAQE